MRLIVLLCAMAVGASAEMKDPDEVFAETDRMIAAHIETFGGTAFQLQDPHWGRPADEHPDVTRVWAYSIGAVEHSKEGLWVAGINLESYMFGQGSIRLYRHENGSLTLLHSSEQTALFRASQADFWNHYEGCLDCCLDGVLADLTLDAAAGMGISLHSKHAHYFVDRDDPVEATVCWMIHGEKLVPVSIDYSAKPRGFEVGRFWDYSLYRKRDTLQADSERLEVAKTETLTPWFESLDVLLAACAGKCPADSAAMIASDRQLRSLWKYRLSPELDGSPEILARSDDACEITCSMYLPLQAGKEANYGTMHFQLRRKDQRWKLESFTFTDMHRDELPK